MDLWWLKGRHLDEFQVGVSGQLASKPEERFLEVIVALCTDVIVLKREEGGGRRQTT